MRKKAVDSKLDVLLSEDGTFIFDSEINESLETINLEG